MNVTTRDIIRIMPLDQALKNKLLNEWDSFSADKRYELERLLWDTFDFLYQIKFEENLQQALFAVKEGNEKLDESLYQRVSELTEREIESELSSVGEKADISAVRKKIMEMVDKDLSQDDNQNPNKNSQTSQNLTDSDTNVN